MNLMQEDLEKNVVSTAIQGAQDIGEFVSLPNESFTTDIYRDIHLVLIVTGKHIKFMNNPSNEIL